MHTPQAAKSHATTTNSHATSYEFTCHSYEFPRHNYALNKTPSIWIYAPQLCIHIPQSVNSHSTTMNSRTTTMHSHTTICEFTQHNYEFTHHNYAFTYHNLWIHTAQLWIHGKLRQVTTTASCCEFTSGRHEFTPGCNSVRLDSQQECCCRDLERLSPDWTHNTSYQQHVPMTNSCCVMRVLYCWGNLETQYLHTLHINMMFQWPSHAAWVPSHAAHYRTLPLTLSHTAAHYCRTAAHCRTTAHALPHCRTLPSALLHTAARNARSDAHTLPCALPHNATHIWIRKLKHTIPCFSAASLASLSRSLISPADTLVGEP
jgi:hypothetical protein